MPRPNTFIATVAAASVAVLSAGALFAQQSSPHRAYSATAVHGIAGQPTTSGTVTKSGQNMRLEFEQNGRKVVQILLPEQGVMYVLDPQTKTYMEMRGQAVPPTTGRSPAAPCDPAQMAQCEKVGSDVVSGIGVERWLLVAQPQTPPVTILWDPTRRHALRQEYPDGSVTAMRFVEMETLNGRATEHWNLEIQAPGRDTLTGGWWYDPDLRVVVREDLPGGEIRRLENISVGAIDPSAFQVPEGWQRRDPTALSAPQPPKPASD